jgi:DNA-binding IclR family transcriptional regulator
MNITKKIFAVLEAFLDHEGELSLEEISRLSGTTKPTARRIALSLVECGYLIQPAKRGKYSLGMKFLDYSGAIKMNSTILTVATPVMIELRQALNESVTLAIWDGTKMALCRSFMSDHPLRVSPDEGSRLVFHASSVGKSLLSALPENEVKQYLSFPLKRYTPNTIVDLDDLIMQLRKCRREGIAYDDEEYYPGVRGVSAVIKSANGHVVAALGVLGPSTRMTRARWREVGDMVKQRAETIARQLTPDGHQPGGSTSA